MSCYHHRDVTSVGFVLVLFSTLNYYITQVFGRRQQVGSTPHLRRSFGCSWCNQPAPVVKDILLVEVLAVLLIHRHRAHRALARVLRLVEVNLGPGGLRLLHLRQLRGEYTHARISLAAEVHLQPLVLPQCSGASCAKEKINVF